MKTPSVYSIMQLVRTTLALAVLLSSSLATAGSGIVTTDFAGDTDTATGGIYWPEDRIVAFGWTVVDHIAGKTDFAIARYRGSTGALDLTFGSGGKVTTDFYNDNDFAYAAVRSGNRLVAAGQARGFNSGPGHAALARYTSHGVLDVTFNGTGKAVTDWGDPNAEFHAVGTLSNGDLVAAGYTGLFGPSNEDDFAVARFDNTGAVVWKERIGFNLTALAPTPAADIANSLAVQTDGRIVVGGETYDASNPCAADYNFALVRLNPDGTLDQTFGTGGSVFTSINGYGYLDVVRLQKDGKIVAAGTNSTSCVGPASILLVRYNTDGSLDTTFGNGGIATYDFDPTMAEGAADLRIQPDGKLVVAGTRGVQEMLVARMMPDGTPDMTFGSLGYTLVHKGGAFEFSSASGVVYANNNVFPVGSFNPTAPGTRDFMVARLDATGTLVPTFGQ
jgi:uncharacterized delta-60 repeat protein